MAVVVAEAEAVVVAVGEAEAVAVAVAVAEAVAVAVTEAVAEADQSIHDQSIHDPSIHPRYRTMSPVFTIHKFSQWRMSPVLRNEHVPYSHS